MIEASPAKDIEDYPTVRQTVDADGDRGAARALTWGEKVSRILSPLVERYLKDGLKRLMMAVARAERLMEEDLLREAGFMLPQSDNARKVVEELTKDQPGEGFPVDAAKKLAEV